MKVYVEAYDKDDNQILGNLDGQSVINVIDFKRTNIYKRLRDTPATDLSLNGRVVLYKFVNESGKQLAEIRKN